MASVNGRSIDEILSSEQFKEGLKDAESVVEYINKNYISLQGPDYQIYMDHLNTILSLVVGRMKETNHLFSKLYEREHFAGSHPDGLRIGMPTEYDMNLIIKLPVDISKLQFPLGNPSFVKINGKEAFAKAASLPAEFKTWVDDDGYLLQTKFRQWMEGVLQVALNTFPAAVPEDGNTRVLMSPSYKKYKVYHHTSGPALTLAVTTPDGGTFDVDLVPAFEFGPPVKWPVVEPLPKGCKKKSWMVVAKPKKLKEGELLSVNDTREWRMSFLDQERELLSGSGTVKPTIKLLKKLRDDNQIKLSSYAIKTMVLFEMKRQSPDFWKNRTVYLFLFMLNRLINQMRTGHIPFYWDPRDDLLKLDNRECENFRNQLTHILEDIVMVIHQNPYIIAEKLLTPNEYQEVKQNCKIPERHSGKSEEKRCPQNQIPKIKSGKLDTALKKAQKKVKKGFKVAQQHGQPNSVIPSNDPVAFWSGYQLIGGFMMSRLATHITKLRPKNDGILDTKHLGLCVHGIHIGKLNQLLLMPPKQLPIADKVILLIGIPEVLTPVPHKCSIAALQSVVETLLKATSSLVILTVPPIPQIMTNSKAVESWTAINNFIRGLSNTPGVRVCDIVPTFMTQWGVKTDLFALRRGRLIYFNEQGMDRVWEQIRHHI